MRSHNHPAPAAAGRRHLAPGVPAPRHLPPAPVRTALLALVPLLLLLLLPVPAGAAPRPVSLAEYRAVLQKGVSHLERADALIKAGKGREAAAAIAQARALLAGEWQVETPHGAVDADLSDLAELLRRAAADATAFADSPGGSRAASRTLTEALATARQHLAAAAALEEASPVEAPGARESLANAMEEIRARSLVQRARDWIATLIGRRISRAAQDVSVPPALTYAAAAIALAVLAWLGFGFYRSLTGHGAGASAALAQRRERPERPPTPAELREQARELSRQGRHLEALRTAHLALLQHLDALGLIRYIPSQTNREHERQLRRRFPNLARTLRALHDLVDERLYSGHGATEEDFLRVDALVEQLWREGDAASKSAAAITGGSSSASSG